MGLGLSPLEAGLFALGWPLGIGIASGASIKRAPRVGRRLLGLGTLLMAAGMGALIAALRLDGVDVSPRHLAPGLALRGPGMGMVAPTLTDFVLAGVPERDAGAAPGVLNTIFQVGSAAGVALAGTAFFALLASQAGLGGEALQAAGAPAQRLVFVSAAERVLWPQVGACGLSFLLVPLLPHKSQIHQQA